jgi:porin
MRMRALSPSTFALAMSLLFLASGTAIAEDIGAPQTTDSSASPPAPTIQTSLGKYGDPGGIRAFLDSKGIDYSFTYIGEVLGNPTGGYKRGATYEGRLDGEFDVDLDKLAGIKDTAFHASVYQIHGRGLTGNNLFDLFTVSGIEAYPDTKLYEAWFEHKFADGKIAVRAGQLAADTEFFLSQSANLFVNSTFGWPASFANDLPSGGPAYPLATPGVRLKLKPTYNITLLAAVFNGDPVGVYQPGINNQIAQLRDVGGTDFRIQDPPLVIAEAQFAYNQEKDAKGLPGTVKVGYLHHFESFAALDVPANVSVNYRGNDSLYGVIDQVIYNDPDGKTGQGAAVFLRVTGLPNDRNLIDVYADGGITYKGLFKSRQDDTIGLSAAYGHISSGATNQDIAAGGPLVRDYQAVIEATYQYAMLPGFTLQPDFQYIFHPGANGVGDPDTGLPLKNAAVFGLRATVVY